MASDILLDRKLGFAIGQKADTYCKDKYSWITGDNTANLTRGVFGVKANPITGGLENWLGDIGRHGVLLEIGSKALGSGYPNGTLADYQKISTYYIGLLLQQVVLHNNIFV